MACADVEGHHALEGGEQSSGLAKGGLQERPPRQLKDLLETLNQGISKLHLYNFKVTTKTSNPPLPQMTVFDPNSISVSVNLPPMIPPLPINPDHLGSLAEYIKRYVIQNQMSSGNTQPITVLKQISAGGHICFLGPAGSGKTTLLRIIALNSIKGRNGYAKIQYAHIIHSGPFEGESGKQECFARHAIFSCNIGSPEDKFTDEESKELFDYALKHPQQFLLIFDSLDTLPQELNEVEDPGEAYNHERKYPPLVHLKMLLSRKLLKGCRIVTSSRPHAIRKFEDALKPTQVISLLGFSRKDALNVLKLYSNNADKIFETVDGKPHLFSLFKEPLFLVYLVKIWQDLGNLDYISATDVLIRIVRCFYRGNHPQGNFQKIQDIQKLARGTLWRRKFEFDETSLAVYGLKIADLTDLCTNASDESGKQIILRLTTGEYPFMFSHQSIQEMFAAIDVAEQNLHNFKKDIEIIHEPFFRKTRDFVYGLTFGRCGHNNSEFPAIKKKCDLLKKSIESIFRIALPPEQLSIFETLAEAISDVGQFNLETAHGVDLSGIPMNDWSLYCTGVATSQFTILQVLHLEACALQLSHLRALEVGICRFNCHQLQILSLSLKGNAGIGGRKEAVQIACKIVRKCRVGDFNIGACGLSSGSMSEMLEGLRHATVAVLGLEQNKIGKKGMEIAGTIVKQYSIKEINLSECAATFREAETFAETAKGSEIQRLIANGRDGKIVCAYGNVIRDCRLRILTILISALKPKDAIRMKNCSSDGKISELQFSASINVTFPFTASPKVDENSCASIRELLPIVKNHIAIPVPLPNKLIENLQSSLDDLQDVGPVIKFPGTIKIFTLMSKKRQNLRGDDESKHETHSVEEIDIQADSANEEEIVVEMESEYLNISNGSDTIAWFNKNKKHVDVVTDILATYGVSIHRYKMTDQDCHLVANIFSHCPELKRFSFSYSIGLKPLLEALIKASNGDRTSLPKVTDVCFAGYQRIDKEISSQFVEFVKLFKAEGLSLTSVDASHDGLHTLHADLKQVVQTGHFKRLEIFHNPDISDKGWECLANIAKDFSNVPLHLSTCYCDVKDERLLVFKDALKSTKLGKIDVCGNRKLTEGGFQTLGEIVKGSEVPSVSLQDCDLDAKKIRGFNSGCGIESPTLEIASLNVANNANLGPNGIEEIKKTIQRFGVKNLNIGSCRLHDLDFDHKFESLDISGNPRWTDISQLTRSVGQRLFMRNCMLNISELKRLASELKAEHRKLTEIDVSDASKEIDCDDVDTLIEVFKDVTDVITVAENISISTSEQRINGTI